MKTIIVVLVLLICGTDAGRSQVVNWRSIREGQHNLLQLDFGYDYGLTAQAGYARTFTMFVPALASVELSVPMGDRVLDDVKIRLGCQMEVLQAGGFSATVRIASVFRTYGSPFVNIASFGSDFGLVAGYSCPTWSAGGEFGFDKAITSHLAHTDLMREMFPGVRDGWYVPTGGNYSYGLQASKTLGETVELSVRGGATRAQKHDENAVMPVYLRLGIAARF
jgi:hypothetical protein